jgi:hypothetical protein
MTSPPSRRAWARSPRANLRVPGALHALSLARLRRLVARCDRVAEELEEQALRVAVVRRNAQKRIDAIEERERPASGGKAVAP